MPKRKDPLVGFHFAVDIQGGVIGYFTECSGLGSENEIIEQKVVNNGQEVILKLPGRLKWENIVLKRGITSNLDIWDWREQIENGNFEVARKNGSIIMYDGHGKEVARWNFERAWPVKITGPQPRSDSNEIGIEELTLVHEYIKRVS